jgi:hypothetical protein
MAYVTSIWTWFLPVASQRRDATVLLTFGGRDGRWRAGDDSVLCLKLGAGEAQGSSYGGQLSEGGSAKVARWWWVAPYMAGEKFIVGLLAVLKPNRIIHKRTDVNCSSFRLRVFLGLSNPQGQRQTSTLSIWHDNFGERKIKFNLGTSRTTQM